MVDWVTHEYYRHQLSRFTSARYFLAAQCIGSAILTAFTFIAPTYIPADMTTLLWIDNALTGAALEAFLLGGICYLLVSRIVSQIKKQLEHIEQQEP